MNLDKWFASLSSNGGASGGYLVDEKANAQLYTATTNYKVTVVIINEANGYISRTNLFVDGKTGDIKRVDGEELPNWVMGMVLQNPTQGSTRLDRDGTHYRWRGVGT